VIVEDVVDRILLRREQVREGKFREDAKVKEFYCLPLLLPSLFS